jgi:hypothetical protein
MLFDQPETLEPEAIINWHSLCALSLDQELRRVHTNMLNGLNVERHLRGALPVGSGPQDAEAYFAACKQEIDLAAVITLIAAAEARIRLDAKLRCKSSGDLAARLLLLANSAGQEYQVALYENGIMDAWKDCVGSLSSMSQRDRDRLLTGIGGFKSLLPVRHWVAHGRYWKLPGGVKRYPPLVVANTVNKLYDTLRETTRLAGLIRFA